MATDPGRVQAVGCGSRIPVAVDLSELDRVAAMIPGRIIVEEGRGFTLHDLMAKINMGSTATQRRIATLQREGMVRFIGYRPGAAREKVYEVVPNPSQN